MERIRCIVNDSVIDPKEIFEFASDRGHGAQNFFFGAVRKHNCGREVVAVSYDAFAPLAEKILKDISLEAIAKWGDTLKVCVVHRTGRLSVGEISVGIGVSSKHRDEAYQASRFVIEQIKVRAPIWKKEHYQNGETEWLKGHALCQHSANEGGHQHA